MARVIEKERGPREIEKDRLIFVCEDSLLCSL